MSKLKITDTNTYLKQDTRFDSYSLVALKSENSKKMRTDDIQLWYTVNAKRFSLWNTYVCVFVNSNKEITVNSRLCLARAMFCVLCTRSLSLFWSLCLFSLLLLLLLFIRRLSEVAVHVCYFIIIVNWKEFGVCLVLMQQTL